MPERFCSYFFFISQYIPLCILHSNWRFIMFRGEFLFQFPEMPRVISTFISSDTLYLLIYFIEHSFRIFCSQFFFHSFKFFNALFINFCS